MRRLLPLFCLLLALTACQPRVDTDPVWQTELPASGVTAVLSNCTVEEGACVYRAEDGTEIPAILLRAEGVPLLTLEEAEGEPATVLVDFAKYWEEGVFGKDITSPMPKLDYVQTVREDGALQYRLDTVYYFYIEVTTGAGTDALVLTCYREIE